MEGNSLVWLLTLSTKLFVFRGTRVPTNRILSFRLLRRSFWLLWRTLAKFANLTSPPKVDTALSIPEHRPCRICSETRDSWQISISLCSPTGLSDWLNYKAKVVNLSYKLRKDSPTAFTKEYCRYVDVYIMIYIWFSQFTAVKLMPVLEYCFFKYFVKQCLFPGK